MFRGVRRLDECTGKCEALVFVIERVANDSTAVGELESVGRNHLCALISDTCIDERCCRQRLNRGARLIRSAERTGAKRTTICKVHIIGVDCGPIAYCE